MLHIGDIVTPKETCIGNAYFFKITEIERQPFENNLYKLERIEQELNPIRGPYFSQLREMKNVETAFWKEDELYVVMNPRSLNIKGPIQQLTTTLNQSKLKGDDNMKDILDIYKERKIKAIHEKYNRIKKEIKEADAIQEIIKDTNRLIQDTNPSIKFPEVILNVYTDETNEDVSDMEKACDMELEELNNLVEEIEAYFRMTLNFEERKTILKNYDIIDKKGKLII